MAARGSRTIRLGLLGASLAIALAAVAAPVERKVSDSSATTDAFADAYRDANGNISAETKAKGAKVYEGLCIGCHQSGVNRAPQRFLLEQTAPESIYRALTTGVMKDIAAGLSNDEKVAVAEYITSRKLGAAGAVKPVMCTGKAAAFDRALPPAFTGWGLDPANSHMIPTATAGIDRRNVGRLKLKWAIGFPNALRARSEPAIAGGAIFVGSHDGTVYALDAATGCARWTFAASAEVRTAIVVSPWKAGDARAAPIAYFGDLTGDVYALDAFTGRQLWRESADEHPSTTLTGAPTLYGDTLFVPVSSLEEGAAVNPAYPCCTFRGSIVALDPRTGRRKWQTFLVPETAQHGTTSAGTGRFGPSGAPVWNSPAVDVKRDRIYFTTGGNYSSPVTPNGDAIIAMDVRTGRIAWSYQAMAGDAWNGSCDEKDKANCPKEDGPDYDFGAGAVLAKGKDGRDYVVSGQKSGIAYGLDAESGKLVWKRQIGRGGVVGGIHFGLAAHGGVAFFPVSDVPDGRKYDMASRPGLYALDVASGDYVWQAPSQSECGARKFCHPGYSGAITITPELLMAGGNDGYLRILDTATGKQLWADDTVKTYPTVNKVPAHGGSMGGGLAPIAYRGMLVMGSGYGFAGKMPGNVLLVYSVE
ncbi:PQQ-binding-like beta-propeller repeat protein [Sphingomonas profundi]|uniref:outer membrane protein assembly factor BamB family protein n=1 Tax=Alterirhizorhabdus profundi TaxID=2681549 RepID=UPI0012E80EA4|nr:PQQ-binding-like beta-propeller repeat protein [Sphingomonas profundi]